MEAEDPLKEVKEFLAEDKQGYSTQTFSVSAMLIDIMKAKSSRESLQQRRTELIERENESEEIVEDLASAYGDSFDGVLQSPALYGQQIEKLRGCIAAAKKKIVASKQSLLKNDKDLQQLNFNSVYNKLIFNKLKAVESEVANLQAAASHLKHLRYLDCSLSLPVLTGRTLLQDHIQNKSEALKDELYTACSMEVYSFCYLTGDVVLPSQSSMLERMKEHRGSWHLDESVPNMEQHKPLYDKYCLLKELDVPNYLKFLWSWEDYDAKSGRLAVIYDVVRAVFNISRSQQLFEYISLNYKKAVGNLYLLMQIFLVFDEKNLAEATKERPIGKSHCRSFYGLCGFNNKDKLQRILKFYAAAVCYMAILARKFLIIRKIYNEFRIEIKAQDLMDAGGIISLALEAISQYLTSMFFPKDKPPEQVTPLQKFLSSSIQVFLQPSFLQYSFVRRSVDNAVRSIIENLLIVKEIEMEATNTKTLKETKADLENRLFKTNSADFSKTLQTKWLQGVYGLLNSHTNRLFLPVQYNEFEAIVDLNSAHQKMGVTKSLQIIKGFLSEEKKEILKEFVACAFYLEQLTAYSAHADVNPKQVTKLSMFFTMMVHLRINMHISKTFCEGEDIKAMETDSFKKSKQYVDLQQACYKQFSNIYRAEQIPVEEGSATRKKQSRRRGVINGVSEQSKRNSSIFTQFRLNDKLRVVAKSMEYLLTMINLLFKQQLEGCEAGALSQDFDRRLDNHQAMNLDDNLMIKLRSLFQSLPQELSALRQCYLALIRRMVGLYMLLKIRCNQIST